MGLDPDIHLPPLSPAAPKKASPKLSKSQSTPAVSSSSPPVVSKKRAEFLERNQQHARNGILRFHSSYVQDCVKAYQAYEDTEFWGAKGVPGFRSFLRYKFGSLLNGWRHLDKDGNGHLSFGEFCLQCRKMGYHGNLKLLWSQLDRNGSGSVSLMELDKDTGHYIATFKKALMEKHGDMLTAWRKGIDVNGNNKIDEAEVVEAVNALGLDLDGKKLYGMLINGPKGMGLSLKQFDPEAWTRWVTGDIEGFTLKANHEFFEDAEKPEAEQDRQKKSEAGGLTKYRQQIAKAEKEALKAEHDNIGRMKAGLHTKEGFKQALISRCGSLYGAWRKALDLDGNGRLTFGEFCQALSRLGMFGEVKSLWKLLDPEDQGYICFKDFDPATDAMLTEFREKLIQEYGNMLLAWMKGVDLRGTNCVNESAFVEACEKVGFSGDAKKLFRVLQPDGSRKYLSLEDFDTPAHQALSRADFRMISEGESTEKAKKKQLEMSFEERQQAGYFWQVREAWKAAHREEFQKACNFVNKEFRIDTTEEFESLCKRKYGSMVSAWRQCLDTDGNGKLTFGEFCAALRRLGYVGSFKSLWKSYDKDNKGVVLMSDIDPKADAQIRSFLDLIGEKYGDLDNAWSKGFGKDPHDSIDVQELKGAAEALGWEGNVNKLFKDLQPMPGRVLISIWDFDPNCSRKRQRGEVAHISNPKEVGEVRLHKKKFGEHGDGLPGEPDKSSQVVTGIPIVQRMRTALKSKYGTTTAAWKTAMDPAMQGQVSFGKFCIVLQDCCFEGKLKVLWDELVDTRLGQTGVTFASVDPESSKILESFRKQMVSQSGSIIQCWKEVLNPSGGPLDEGAFTSACQEAGFSVKNPKKLFKLLLARVGQRSITGGDLRTLLIGVSAQDRVEVWGAKQSDKAEGQAESGQVAEPGAEEGGG